MGSMSGYEQADQANWNMLAPLHAASAYYDVEGFKAGRNSLLAVEREEVGDVAGKSLLHLQCHFGMDTLSWARLGAEVTGVDYAEKAIELARELSQEVGLEARWVWASIYDLPERLSGSFDIVFTSYGVLCWLPDLARWGKVIAHFLKPGGFFYIVDGHPMANIYYDEKDATRLEVAYPYFEQATPEAYVTDGSYATDAKVRYTEYEWPHSLSEIVNAVAGAGLRLEFLHEFPYAAYRCLPFMEQGADGWWRLTEHQESVPLLFSLKASKPGAEGTGGEL